MELAKYKEIKVEGHRGFWSVIEEIGKYVLLEHNTYGDECAFIVANKNDVEHRYNVKCKSGRIIEDLPIVKESCETFDDLQTAIDEM